MTTTFPDKETAIKTGFYYAGVVQDYPEKVPKPEPGEIATFGEVKDVEMYTIKNKNGDDATFAIGKFLDGYDLWLLGPDKTGSLRV